MLQDRGDDCCYFVCLMLFLLIFIFVHFIISRISLQYSIGQTEMEDIAQVFKKSSTIALSKTFYYVNDKMAFEIRSRVAVFSAAVV